MLFRALSIASLALAILVSGCGDTQREINKASYEGWLQKIHTPIAADPSKLEGVWMLGAEGSLYRDRYDRRYDSDFGRRPQKSGELLLIHDGNIKKAVVRLGCPAPHGNVDASWMVKLGYVAENAEASPALSPRGFLMLTRARSENPWATFTLDGQVLKTSTKLRGLTDASDAPVTPYEIRIVEQQDDRLDLAYIHPNQAEGVHTVIEVYRRLGGPELTALLKESSELKPCPKPK